jgi:hypothetical protein
MGSTIIKNIKALTFKAEQWGNQADYFVIVAKTACKNVRPLSFRNTIIGHGFSSDKESLYDVKLYPHFNSLEGGMYHRNDEGDWLTPEDFLSAVRKSIRKPVSIKPSAIRFEFVNWGRERNTVPFDGSLLKSSKVNYDGVPQDFYCDFVHTSEFKEAIDNGFTDSKQLVNALELYTKILSGDILLPKNHHYFIKL